ncbi:MAG: site-specific integrase [Propionicimonas sp.]
MINPATGKPIRDEPEARRVLREWLREEPAAETVSQATTVKAWSEKWLLLIAERLDPNTYRNHASAVHVWIVPTIGTKKLARLTPGDIRAVTKAMLDAGRKPATAIRAHVVLREMLTAAQLEGYAVPERVLKVKPPQADEDAGRDDIPVADAIKILAAAQQPDGSESRWMAAFLQGVRPAEALGLCWDLVDLDAETLDVSWQLISLPYNTPHDRSSGFRIPVGYTARHLVGAYHLVRPKTSAGQRLIPMVPWMAESLRKWKAGAPDLIKRAAKKGPASEWGGLVWPRGATEHHPERAGWPTIPKADTAAWGTLCGAAGVRAYDLYSCRHTTATLLREAGVKDDIITAIVGHASIRSTRPYLHPDQRAEMLDALGKVAGRLQLRS